MRCVSNCLLGIVLVALAAPRAVASDQAELDRRFDEAMAVAQSEGGSSGTEALLRSIVQDAPDYEPARAELGEVKVDGRWLPVDYAQHLASEDARLAEYQQLREEADGALSDHARLARWCEKQGLEHESRSHWLRVLDEKPNHPAALKSLGAVWRDGMLWDTDLAREADNDAKRRASAERAWEHKLVRLEKGWLAESDVAGLSSQWDADAFGPMTRRIESLSSPQANKLSERRRRLAEAFLKETKRLDGSAVTAGLCRLVVTTEDASLWEQAVDSLAGRPVFEAAPQLLSHLAAPIESEHQIAMLPTGGFAYQHQAKAEGVDTDREWNRRQIVHVPFDGLSRVGGAEAQLDALWRMRVRLLGQVRQAKLSTNQVESQIATYNERVEITNARVTDALQRVTGRSLGDSPRAWWDYWQVYTGYDLPDERPVERLYEGYETTDYTYVPPPPPRCECFVAGTPVWTRTGKTAIEKLKAGDLVLARDPHRGGLTYRAVLDTTVRKPSPMVTLSIGAGDSAETIRATVGHPFWVLGDGWRMAENLEPGDLVSTIAGPQEVTRVLPGADRQAFNLVVEGAANYYVGDAGVLVHDNTPRRPAVGLIARR